MIDPAMAATAVLALSSARARGVDLSLASVGATLRHAVEEDPMQAALATVLGSSVLFYYAERGANPEVRRFEDALVFCTTCLNVGYAQIYARTPTGKAIAAFLMTYGPALASKILDPPRRDAEREAAKESEALLAAQRSIADKLDAILSELQRVR